MRLSPLCSLVAILATALPLYAADYAWTGGNGLWSGAAMWSNNPYAGGTTGTVPTAADTATFNQSTVNGPQTVALDADYTVLGLTFLNTGTTALQSDSLTPRLLTLGANGLQIVSGSGTVALGGANILNVGLAASQTWVNNSSNIFTVANGISLTNAGVQTLTVGGTGNTLFSGIVADGVGTLGIVKTDSGTLTLGGVNTFNGTTTISGGTLAIAADSALGTAPPVATPGSLTIGTNAVLAATATLTLNANRGIALAPLGSINIASGTTLTYGGIIANSGTGSLILSGGGTLQLTGANTYTGGTTILAGTTLRLGNGTFNGSIPATGAVVNNGTINIQISATAQTFGSAISGVGNLTVTGTAGAAVTFSGASSFTGTVTLGTLNNAANQAFTFTNATALGAPYTSGLVTMNSGNGGGTGSILNVGTGSTAITIVGKTLLLASGTTRTSLNTSTTGGATWAGNILISGSGVQLYANTASTVLTVGTSAAHIITPLAGATTGVSFRGGGAASTVNSTFNILGNIGRTDSTAFTVTSPYNVSSSTSNSQGNLIVGANNAFMPTAGFTMGQSSGGSPTLTLGTFSQTFTSLSDSPNVGTATITGTSGSVFTLNNTNASTFGQGASTSTNGLFAGSVALTKIGSGSLTINSRAVNTTTGTITVNQGTLNLSNVNFTTAVNIWNSAASLALGGGTFQLTARPSTTTSQTFANLTINTGSSAVVVNNTVTGAPSSLLTIGQITRPLTSGTVAFTLPDGVRTATNGIAVTTPAIVNGILGGWATVGNDWAAVDTATGNTIAAYAGYMDIPAGILSSDPTANVRFTAAAPTTITAAAAGTIDANTLLQNGTGGTLTYAVTAPTDVLRLGSAGGVMVSASGSALTLGDSVANGGILTAGGANDTAGSISFWANSTTNPVTVNMAIADNGIAAISLAKAGPGTLILNGANTYSGGTSLGAGTLTLGTAGALGNTNNALTITGGTLNLNGNSISIGILRGFGGTIQSNVAGPVTFTVGNNNSTGGVYYGILANGTGTLSLAKGGSGTFTLAGNNTYTGTTNVTGTLQIGADTGTGTLGTGAVTVNTGSTLAFNRADAAYIVANQITGAGGVSFIGRGTVTLTNAGNNYSGTTTISAGTLALSGGNNRLPAATTLAFDNTRAFASWFNLGSTSQTLRTMTFANLNISTVVTGTGTLTINGATDLNIGQTNAAAANLTTVLDLSGLSNFVFSSPANIFRVGIASSAGGFTSSATNINSVVTLAGNNTITAATLGIQDQSLSGNAGNAILLLGTTNTINVNAVNAGFSNRSGGTFAFAPGLAGATAVFRNTNGTSPVGTFNIGQNANNSPGTTFSFNTDFTGGSIDLLVNSMIVGQADTFGNTSRSGSLNASFAFGAGTVAINNTLSIGIIANTGGVGTVSAAGPFAANGTFTVNGPGTLAVPTISLATNTISETQNTTNKIVGGTLNLLGGTITATAIQVGAQTGTATSVNAAFNWVAGTLQNTANANLLVTGTGSVNLPVTLSTGAAKLLVPSSNQSITFAASAPIGGSGGLTVNGPGTVVLAAANTYTGGTTVNQGTLTVTGSLAAANAVAVNNTATLNGLGTVGGTVTVNFGGTVRGDTGANTGALNLGNTTVVRGGNVFANLGAPGTSSQLALGANTLNLSTGSILTINDVGGFAYGTYTIATTTGGTLNNNGTLVGEGFVFGTFVQGTGYTGPIEINTAGLLATPANGDIFTLSRSGTNLVLSYAAVPEPATVLGFAVAGLLLARRNRTRHVS